MKKTWLVTGCSTGFGRVLCQELVQRGENVVATARKVESIRDLQSPNCLIVRLDVTDQDSIDDTVAKAIEKFGRIDVLVNNAGYGEMGAIEEFETDRARSQFETNVFGVLNVQRAVLPHMRNQGGGHVIQISSISGLASYPFVGIYCASKHALEAVSEALAQEVKEFGIKVTLVEPGRFRTDFAGRSLGLPKVKPGPYEEFTKDRISRYEAIDGKQPGDPLKAVRAIIQVADSKNPPLRLLLGKDAYEWAQEKINSVLKEIEEWKDVTLSTDFEEASV